MKLLRKKPRRELFCERNVEIMINQSKIFSRPDISEHNLTAAKRTNSDIEEFNNRMAEAMLRIAEEYTKSNYFQHLMPHKLK